MSLRELHLFPGSAPSTSLGFGTTSMMALPTTHERLALLNSAFEVGIRHFDTAPYYGYGEAERVLGEFLRGRREHVTVATKFGIQPPRIVRTRWVNLLARGTVSRLRFLHKAASRTAVGLSKKRSFQASEARKSLERSLSALKTDYVDLFLLHEPTFGDAGSEELVGFLGDELRNGRIRAFGCGGDYQMLLRIATARLRTSEWLQFEDSALNRSIERIKPTGAKCITFGTFKAVARLHFWLESVPSRRASWEHELGCPLRSEESLAAFLQVSSHARNPDGIVLFSTKLKNRVAAAGKVASEKQFSDEQLRKFDELSTTVQDAIC